MALLPRYVATWSAGAPLRITKDADLDQGTLAPLYSDALVGYLFGGSGSLQHGAGVGLSLNLTDEGGFTEPVYAGHQFVIMPAYLIAWDLHPDLFALGHVGLPVLATSTPTAGLELAGALGYRVLAGWGVFAEVGADAFWGAASTIHATVSLEVGIFLDYEVLP